MNLFRCCVFDCCVAMLLGSEMRMTVIGLLHNAHISIIVADTQEEASKLPGKLVLYYMH